MTADWERFCFFPLLPFFAIFCCCKQIIIFLPKKKEKKKSLGCPTGHNFGHPLDSKHTFFKGGLNMTTWSKAKYNKNVRLQ